MERLSHREVYRDRWVICISAVLKLDCPQKLYMYIHIAISKCFTRIQAYIVEDMSLFVFVGAAAIPVVPNSGE